MRICGSAGYLLYPWPQDWPKRPTAPIRSIYGGAGCISMIGRICQRQRARSLATIARHAWLAPARLLGGWSVE